MIGLEGHRPDMTDYHDAINLIESHVKKFTTDELEKMNAEKRQAGVTCLKWEDFKKTNYVRVIEYLELTMLILLRAKVSSSKVLGSLKSLRGRLHLHHFLRWTQEMGKFRPLAGIRVIEMCRIIAGPAIGRTLAEYGADVIKITPPHLSDVPFFPS